MARCNPGLEMVAHHIRARARGRQVAQALRDLTGIPSRPVLVREQQEAAAVAGARGQARGAEVHQREQRVRRRPVAKRMGRQQAREPDRLRAQVGAEQRVA